MRRLKFPHALFLLAVLLLTLAAPGHAAGLHAGEQVARASVMAGPMGMLSGDAVSLPANPACLSLLRGTQLSIGATVMVPDNRFQGSDPGSSSTKMQSQVLFPPNFLLAHTFNSGIGLAIGVTMPYTFRNEWNADWTGGRIATRSELRTLYVSPSVAFPLTSALSFGASVNIVFSRFLFSRRIGYEQYALRDPVPDGSQSFEMSPRPLYGFQLGLLLKPGGSPLSIGLAYERRVKLDMEDGTVSFAGIPAPLAASFPEDVASTSLTLPDHLHAGLGLQLSSWLYAGGDVEYTLWNTLGSMRVSYREPVLQNNPSLGEIALLDWHNTLSARCAIEVAVIGVLLRAGYLWDQDPAPAERLTPAFPSAERNGYSIGIGYDVGEGLTLDFTYSYLKSLDRTITNSLVEYSPGHYLNGAYTGRMTLFGINVSYAWN